LADLALEMPDIFKAMRRIISNPPKYLLFFLPGNGVALGGEW
jgi:hypothetical protein